MADKVSATEKLRAMLDERGVKHNDFNDNGRLRTFWAVRGIEYSYVEIIYPDGQCETLFSMNTIFDATPEQAIAATVGEHDTHAYEEGYADGFDRGQEAIIQQVDGIIHDPLSRIHDLETMIEDFWKERDS